jgi:hypothetical protein
MWFNTRFDTAAADKQYPARMHVHQYMYCTHVARRVVASLKLPGRSIEQGSSTNLGWVIAVSDRIRICRGARSCTSRYLLLSLHRARTYARNTPKRSLILSGLLAAYVIRTF